MITKARKALILDLRPTQFCLGLVEVDNKVAKMKKMSAKELSKYIKAHVVPVVVGPNKDLYLIDNHHFVRACWEFGLKDVHIKVVARMSHQPVNKFWASLKHIEWCFLKDQFGKAQHEFQLPKTIRGMGDDSYRSLAWIVREKGGFKKSTVPFTEFYWGDLFRRRMRWGPNEYDPLSKKGIMEALRLCKDSQAKKLPGYKREQQEKQKQRT